MTSTDFALAQQRIAARRQAREAETTSRLTARQDASRTRGRIAQLPFPLGRLGQAGITTWDSIRGREGTRPAFRVGQVDAELLDEELLELLKGQVGEGLKYFGSHIQDEWSAEIMLVLRAVLFKLSVWDHGMYTLTPLVHCFTDVKSRCYLRSGSTKSQVYRCKETKSSSSLSVKMAKSALWDLHCRRAVCLERSESVV